MKQFVRGAEVRLIDDKQCTSSKKGDLFILLSKCHGSSDPDNPTWAVFRVRDKKDTNLKQCRFELTGKRYIVTGDSSWNRQFTGIHEGNVETRYDGWVNPATAEAATVFFNDSHLLSEVKRSLTGFNNVAWKSAMFKLQRIKISSPGEVCTRSIMEQWVFDMIEQDRISANRAERVLTSVRANIPKVQPSQHDDFNDAIAYALDVINSIPEEEKMVMKIETKHYVNDVELSSMNTEQRIALIAKTEKHIDELKAVKTKSKMVTAEIEKAEKFLADAVKLFDGE